jgi:peptidoglycan glycosyltransferase
MYYEQMGFVGVALVAVLFLVILHRLFRISLRTQDRFSHWLCLGFASALAVQTVYIVGANFGAWPLTGVTLAPLAFGKAACVSAFVMVWVVLGASDTAGVRSAHVPESRRRTVGWVFALFTLMLLFALGKAFKVGVLDRDRNALAHYGAQGTMNARVAVQLAGLSKGRILARTNSESYDDVKVLAQSTGSDNDRVYTLGPAAWPVVGVSTPFGTTGGELRWRSRLTGAYSLVQTGPMSGTPQDALETALLSQWRAKHYPLWPARSEWDGRLRPKDVQTTIATSLQTDAYNRLSDYLSGSLFRKGTRPRKGAILIADVRTGEYLAKVQFPSMDPNELTSGWSAWDRVSTDPAGYLDPNGQIIDLVDDTDRAPGSTAKLNTIMALLSSGYGGSRFWCGPNVRVNGHAIHDFGGNSHGWVDPEEIIKYSCNRGAAQAAELVGSRRLLSLYREKLRYPLPHMQRPDRAFHDNYDKIAFGQSMSASLRDLMTTLCTVARGGEAIELHAIRKRPEDVERWRVCSAGTANQLTRFMVSVARPGGTAYTVYKGQVAWPSKTGSAEVQGADKTDAWFVGFAPAEEPKVAFVLWVEEDGTGGNMARNLGVVPLVKHAVEVADR